MADPKLLVILKGIQSRLEVINGLDPYFSRIGEDVQRGRRAWNPDDLPCCSVFLNPRAVDQDITERQALAASVNIEARMNVPDGQLAEDWAVYMLADIQRAVEITARSLGGKVIKQVAFEGDSIAYPDNDIKQVAVNCAYSIPHIRQYGDPDN